MDAASRHPAAARIALGLLGRLILDAEQGDTEQPSQCDQARAQVEICGFPRTGTTFLHTAFAMSLGGARAVWKTHDPYSLRNFPDWQRIVVVPVREPWDAIASWSLYNRDEPSVRLMRSRLRTYASWHRIVLSLKIDDQVKVVDFDEFTSEPGATVEALTEQFTCAMSPTGITSATVHESLRAANDLDDIAPQRRNLPSAAKDRGKVPYYEVLSDGRLRSQLEAALDLHDSLAQHAVTIGDRIGMDRRYVN